MITALVLHAPSNREEVRDRLIPLLPSMGFEGWISATGDVPPRASMGEAARRSSGVFVAVSAASVDSSALRSAVQEALETAQASATAVVPLLLDASAPADLVEALASRPTVDLHEPRAQLREKISELIPFDAERWDSGSEPLDPDWGAEPIWWNEEVFSEALVAALERKDHRATDDLVAAFERHAERREVPYPEQAASRDLAMLRHYRKFDLMRRLAECVLATGTRDTGAVRKLYAQSLIESQAYDEALPVLEALRDDAEALEHERESAQGLIGRMYKQRYLDDPDRPDAQRDIRLAIQTYEDCFEDNPSSLWLGINAMSCTLRASGDGVAGVDPGRARDLARLILDRLDTLEDQGALGSWDHAIRVEALAALDRYEEAERELGAYLDHPDTMPFAVASTYRQFTQLLRLGGDPRAASLMARLKKAVERHRSGSVLRPEPELDLGGLRSGRGPSRRKKPLVIRVADPGWEPDDVPDLEITARVGTVVAASGTQSSVDALLEDFDVISVEESHPAGTEECSVSVPFIGAAAVWQSADERGANVLIAVVDNGIDVLHEAFWDDEGNPRIVEIWDQQDDTGPPPEGFDLGTVHTADDIAGYVRDGTVPAGLGRNERGHGTHVASIAAGRAAGEFAGGVAPEARILFVRPASREYIGYSASHIQALDYIDKVAKRLRLPVVVNVSQGMNAGAHDGKSALEVAFNEFSGGGRRRGRVIVKSAGNERHKGGHAKVTMRPSALEKLRWYRDPNARFGMERIELWWSSADELEFALGDPDGEVTPWVAAGGDESGAFASGNQYRVQYTKRHVDNGDSRALVEINRGSEQNIAPGVWELRIKSGDVPEGGVIHAWIERGSGVATNFENHGNEEMTLSIPGTAESVISVGAVETMDDIVMVGEFSSYGPTRDNRQKPEVAAPGVNISAADGGTTSGARVSQGTSMAAPHVAGAIGLLLSRNPRLTATQIASALRQKTRDYNGTWDPGGGWGVVDVQKLLAAF